MPDFAPGQLPVLVGRFVIAVGWVEYLLGELCLHVYPDGLDVPRTGWGLSGTGLLDALELVGRRFPSVAPLRSDYEEMYKERNHLVHAAWSEGRRYATATHAPASRREGPDLFEIDLSLNDLEAVIAGWGGLAKRVEDMIDELAGPQVRLRGEPSDPWEPASSQPAEYRVLTCPRCLHFLTQTGAERLPYWECSNCGYVSVPD